MKPLLIFLLSALIPSAFALTNEASAPAEMGMTTQKVLVILGLLTATLAVVIATLENAAVRAAALKDLETNAAQTPVQDDSQSHIFVETSSKST